MRRELIAAAVLILLLAAVILNSVCITRLAEELTETVDEAEASFDAGKFEASAAKAAEAAEIWNTSAKYTHVVLGHDDVGLLSDALFKLVEDIFAGDADTVRNTSEMVRLKLRNIARSETLSPGSVF